MTWSPRCVPLAESEYGATPDLYACAECGAVVVYPPVHDKWHRDLTRKVGRFGGSE